AVCTGHAFGSRTPCSFFSYVGNWIASVSSGTSCFDSTRSKRRSTFATSALRLETRRTEAISMMKKYRGSSRTPLSISCEHRRRGGIQLRDPLHRVDEEAGRQKAAQR